MNPKSPTDKLLDGVEWQETGMAPPTDGSPYATHVGVLRIGPIALGCYRLNDGRRILDKQDMDDLFGGDA